MYLCRLILALIDVLYMPHAVLYVKLVEELYCLVIAAMQHLSHIIELIINKFFYFCPAIRCVWTGNDGQAAGRRAALQRWISPYIGRLVTSSRGMRKEELSCGQPFSKAEVIVKTPPNM